MKRPVWSLELARELDVPVEALAARFGEGLGLPWGAWSGRPADPGSLRLGLDARPCWGVTVSGLCEAAPAGSGTRLVLKVRFRGWPVPFLMGYWRMQAQRAWARFGEAP